MRSTSVADAIGTSAEDDLRKLLGAADAGSPEQLVARLEAEMLAAAKQLEFERAASLRDRIDDIRATVATAAGVPAAPGDAEGGRARARRAANGEPRRIKRRFGADR
jgi:excinuclease ABC subunit B